MSMNVLHSSSSLEASTDEGSSGAGTRRKRRHVSCIGPTFAALWRGEYDIDTGVLEDIVGMCALREVCRAIHVINKTRRFQYRISSRASIHHPVSLSRGSILPWLLRTKRTFDIFASEFWRDDNRTFALQTTTSCELFDVFCTLHTRCTQCHARNPEKLQYCTLGPAKHCEFEDSAMQYCTARRLRMKR